MIKCALCRFAEPFVDRPAEFVVDGQAVCEDHVDDISGTPFGRALSRLHLAPKEDTE